MPICTKDLNVAHLSALVASYVASRLSEVQKSDAWSPGTLEYLFGPIDEPIIRPFPPPPPVFQDLVNDIVANLKDPNRPDLASNKVPAV